ncbi:MAG: isoprenylcysteine carboxylmethyltransferase family protein [Halioglobus sp.]
MIIRAYGLLSYLFAMTVFVVFILFANNHLGLLGVPALLSLNIDQANGPPSDYPLVINLALLLLFGLQHSVMARGPFKSWLVRFMPESAERSTYVLMTGVVMLLIVQSWQPMTTVIWQANSEVLRAVLTGLFFAGWTITFSATFMLNHFHLFGLQQSFKHADPDAGAKIFKTPLFYRLVRHPIQSGVVLAMVATPDLTVGRAVLAGGILVYVAIGLYYEEKDLVAFFGDTYRDYKSKVPGVIPGLKGKR